MRILFTGGGSGGHFFPIIAVARELKGLCEESKVLNAQLFYTGPDEYDRETLAREDIIFQRIAAGKIRRYISIKNISDIFSAAIGVFQALWKIFVIAPDVVFSKGGYGSFPTLFAARLYRIPVVIHDSDAIPGMVTRWSSRFARRIWVAFPSSAKFFPPEKTAVVGNPIRKQIIGGAKDRAKENLSIFSQRPVIFVFGGSQGALPINQMILGNLAESLKDFEIIHQIGKAHYQDILEQVSAILSREERRLYHPFAFLSESQLREVFAASDVVIARSGASNIFEIAAAGKPSILIPLPHSAQDHQRENAYQYAKATGALVIEEENATPHLVHHALLRLFESPDQLRKMAAGALAFARPESAELIAREILELALSNK